MCGGFGYDNKNTIIGNSGGIGHQMTSFVLPVFISHLMIDKSPSGKIFPLRSFSYLSSQLWEKPAGQISSFQSFRHFLCPENLTASNGHLARPLQDPRST